MKNQRTEVEMPKMTLEKWRLKKKFFKGEEIKSGDRYPGKGKKHKDAKAKKPKRIVRM